MFFFFRNKRQTKETQEIKLSFQQFVKHIIFAFIIHKKIYSYIIRYCILYIWLAKPIFPHKYSKISHLENIYFQKHNKLFTGINRIRCVVRFVVYTTSFSLPPHTHTHTYIYYTSNFRHKPWGFETNIFGVCIA